MAMYPLFGRRENGKERVGSIGRSIAVVANWHPHGLVYYI